MPVPVLFAFGSLAGAAPLSLQAALEGALAANPSLVSARLAEQQADQGVRASRGSADPTLTASGTLTSAETVAFLGSSPYAIETDSREWGLSVGGRTPFGTTWGVQSTQQRVDSLVNIDLSGLGLPIPTDDEPQALAYTTAALTLTLRQDLLVPFRRTDDQQRRLDATEARAEAELRVEATRQSTLSSVAAAWWAWSLASERVGLAEGALDRAERLEARTDAWLAEGQIGRVEQSQARQATREAAAQLRAARGGVDAAADDLLVLLGQDPGTAIEPSGTTEVGTLELDVAAAAANNPDVRLAALHLQAAERAHRDARRDRLPSLAAVGSVGTLGLEDTGGDAWQTVAQGDGYDTASAGLELAMPLGNRAARAQADAAALQVEVARRTRDATERDVVRALRAALADRDRAALEVELAEQDRVVTARTVAIEDARVQEGTRLFDDLLDAQAALQQSELAVLDARLQLQRANLVIAVLAGRVDDVL
jgi:outer membrane protein TolC